MGMFDNFLSLLKINKEKMTVLVVGLNNSGKSTIINNFKRKNEANSYISVPTVGFTNEEFYSHGIQFTVIDMSGAWKYRNLWQHQFKSCQGIIYVIDSSDNMRMVVVKEELYILLQHPDLVNRQTPILFYANKNDCENSLSSVNIAAALDLTSVMDKPWHISSSSAKTGDGLDEGVQWLIQQIRLKNQKHHSKKDKSKRK
ncbi:ADP-ribosylation factor-like protein 6 [Calliphora vicina]|uniref:ADP-ribosylation factor-like protein 6 n=1 Tax=Calliphora vicina TaxID=7373 RepID=UPI00325B6F40